LEFEMAAKRRNHAKGPLLTFAVMIGSVLAVLAVARMVEPSSKTEKPATTAVASDTSQQVNRQ
jgi:hypothetical protein